MFVPKPEAEHGRIEEILPTEILSYVFILCLPKNPLRRVQPDLSRAPMLLCRVCSYWKTIALNTPQLWNNLHHRLPIPRYLPCNAPFWESIRPSSLDFLEWWSNNVKGNSLSLRLVVKWTGRKHSHWVKNNRNRNRSGAFLVSMFESARVIEIEESCALILEEKLQLSSFKYPNLESMFILDDPDDLNIYRSGLSLASDGQCHIC